MRRLILVPVMLLLPACDFRQDQRVVAREAPPPAAMLAPGQGVDLTEMLRLIEAEVDLALDGDPSRVLTAEAMTDQLLHAPRDIDWLATGYSVEARLRQIQAQADAVVARMRRGATLAGVDADLRTLRASVQDLQRQLALPGGGAAPPTLETLLAQDPLRDARARVGPSPAPAGQTPAPLGQPLGTPARPDDLP
jgi:hypothetical protein